MSRPDKPPAIRLRGVRQNNLKNFDLDIPLRQLSVITGLSGSGKSSLAFDTLFAEGQRRYIETFSPYARQFFDRMDKPQVDRIEGIPPAIAIEQKNSVRTTRSTVGTMTEICEYMKLTWAQLAQLQCKQCHRPVRKEPPAVVWSELARDTSSSASDMEFLITFDLPLGEKLSLAECLDLISRQGYQRLLHEGRVVRVEEAETHFGKRRPIALTVVQDRLKRSAATRARFVEACEQAYHFGKGHLAIWRLQSGEPLDRPADLLRLFSNRFHCAECDLDYREPSAALFSFNHPVGACPTCRGFGRVIGIDYGLAIPDRSKTLAGGLVRPWQTGVSADCQRDLMKACRGANVPVQVPFCDLSQQDQDWVINGEAGYGADEEHEWPRAWYGVKGYFRWLESKSYKMHVRVLLSRYRSYTQCPDCLGKRFQPESLLYRLEWPTEITPPASLTTPRNGKPQRITLADFYQLPVSTALACVGAWIEHRPAGPRDPLSLVLGEVHARLRYLDEVGLGYVTLDRPTRTLSGGETERVNLTSCLGTRLVNTLFVLDEPSVGLHARDTERLVRILERLRDTGNTVVVVEHEASVMRAADQIIDLGPGQGERGGQIIFQGTYAEILCAKESLTGGYLSGRRQIGPFSHRLVTPLERSKIPRTAPFRSSRPLEDSPGSCDWLTLIGARAHNLDQLDVSIPLGRLVCLTGVSGSGKTTLARDVLLPALEARMKTASEARTESDEADASTDQDGAESETESGTSGYTSLEGAEVLDRVVLVDQSPLGKTPRSNPVVYVGAFEHIRILFAETEMAKQRGLSASGFSFNSKQGQCERCRGAGFEKIEMQFLSDVFIRCADCNGRRYREHILEIKLQTPVSTPQPTAKRRPSKTLEDNPLLLRESLNVAAGVGAINAGAGWSIADMLEATIEDAVAFLSAFVGNRHAARALKSLRLLQDVGLGYLRLGQPINTLSGGESQRIKLVSFLAESAAAELGSGGRDDAEARSAPRTFFVFDEPTTGLHFDDVRVLLLVFQRLVDTGHSILVIEHNLDVIRAADWVIDLGPEAGEGGGKLVVAGTPEVVAACENSHTGAALRGPSKRAPKRSATQAIESVTAR